MDRDRMIALECSDETLTEEEIAEGWHFCEDWDFMIMKPDDGEVCSCGHERP